MDEDFVEEELEEKNTEENTEDSEEPAVENVESTEETGVQDNTDFEETEKLNETETTRQSADEFIQSIKKYLEAPELTREICYELIDRIIVGGLPKVTGKERTIEIVYKIDIASVLRHKFR